MLVTVAVVLAGCAGGANRGPVEAGRTDRITRDQIGATSYSDAFELITAMRGSWLRTRGPDSFGARSTEIQVYRDDVRLGGVSNLRYIHPMEIEYVRFFDGVQASARWGFDHGSGVIYIASRRD